MKVLHGFYNMDENRVEQTYSVARSSSFCEWGLYSDGR